MKDTDSTWNGHCAIQYIVAVGLYSYIFYPLLRRVRVKNVQTKVRVGTKLTISKIHKSANGSSNSAIVKIEKYEMPVNNFTH